MIKVSTTTHPNGHLDPDFSMDEVRSKSWKTRLLAPAAFIATVYNPDSPDMDDPTESKIVEMEYYQTFNQRQTIVKLLKYTPIKQQSFTCEAVKDEGGQSTRCHAGTIDRQNSSIYHHNNN